MANTLLSNEDLENLIKDVEYISSNKQLGKKYGLTRKQVGDLLYRNKVRRSYTNQGRVNFNENFFSKFSELSCYWAGFIAADGCITNNSKRKFLTIALQEKDQIHLENFSKQLESSNLKIIKRFATCKNKKYPYSSIILYSKKICEDLEKNFNIVKQKTLKTIYPTKMPEKYSLDFIRGYIDGDGSISIYKDKGSLRLSITFVGNLSFVKSIANVIGIKYSISINSKGLATISYNNYNSIKAIRKIYLPGTKFCLERKREKYYNFLNSITSLQKNNIIKRMGLDNFDDLID